MEKKYLGKICSVEYGYIHASFFGLNLAFEFSGSRIGTSHLINLYEENMTEDSSIAEHVKYVAGLLKQAKIYNINDLLGIPVELILENSRLKSFRILTEVL